MRFSDHRIETMEGLSDVLVATPKTDLIVGRTQLEKLRKATVPRRIDEEIHRQLLIRGGRVRALILRGRDDEGNVRWRFDKDLSPAEIAELGYLLVKSQVVLYRCFAEVGVRVHFIVEVDEQVTHALNKGKDRLLNELKRELEVLDEESPKNNLFSFRVWLLENFMYFPYVTADEAIEGLLPETLPILEGGQRVVQKMLDYLPPHERAHV